MKVIINNWYENDANGTHLKFNTCIIDLAPYVQLVVTQYVKLFPI